jgi:hypothetical protein
MQLAQAANVQLCEISARFAIYVISGERYLTSFTIFYPCFLAALLRSQLSQTPKDTSRIVREMVDATGKANFRGI